MDDGRVANFKYSWLYLLLGQDIQEINQFQKDHINYAHFKTEVTSLGPGQRSVIWTQACPLNCYRCISPEWQAPVIANVETVSNLTGKLYFPRIEGLTISGGEPFLQTTGLVSLIRELREKVPFIDIICYSGFTLEQLTEPKLASLLDSQELLKEMDILIDGPYIESLNDDSGLRGSSNQRVHILKPNPKYEGFNFESNPRIIEYLPKLELRDGNLINTEEFAGIPSIQFTRLWRRENG